MKEESTYELIDLFLSGSMPANHEFLTQLKADPQLAEEVEVQKLVRNAVVDFRLMEVSKQLHGLKNQVQPTPAKSKVGRWVLLALSIGIMLSGILFINKNNDKHSPVNIIKKSDPDPNSFNGKEEHFPVIREDSKIKRIENGKKSSDKGYTNIPLAIYPSPDSPLVPEALLSDKKPIEIISHQTITEDSIKGRSVNQDFTFTRPCDTTSIKAVIKKVQPCDKTNTGSLHLENVSGGALPYTFSIDGGKHFQADKIFLNLSAGKFDLVIKDKNNCLGEIGNNLELSAKPCVETNSYIFDPTRDSWEIPNDKQKNGRITIYNKNGQVVYVKNFTIMEQLTWNGTSENGEILKPGYYIYTIEQDGNSLKQGSVTLSY